MPLTHPLGLGKQRGENPSVDGGRWFMSQAAEEEDTHPKICDNSKEVAAGGRESST